VTVLDTSETHSFVEFIYEQEEMDSQIFEGYIENDSLEVVYENNSNESDKDNEDENIDDEDTEDIIETEEQKEQEDLFEDQAENDLTTEKVTKKEEIEEKPEVDFEEDVKHEAQKSASVQIIQYRGIAKKAKTNIRTTNSTKSKILTHFPKGTVLNYKTY